MTDEKIDVEFKEEDLTDVNEFTEEELSSEDTDWKAQAQERTGIAKRRTTQLKKAKDVIEQLRAEKEALKNPTEDEPEQKPQDKNIENKKGLDRADKAYLLSRGFDEEDFDRVEEALPHYGGDLEKALASPYLKSELETAKTEREARSASPEGGGGGTGGGQDTVEYWEKKGGMPPADLNDPVRTKLRADIARARAKNPPKVI